MLERGYIMGKVNFNQKHKKILDSFLLNLPVVVPGKMFGHPAYYVEKKLFASLYMEGVCVKVPEKLANELIGQKGIIPFQPMGKKMRKWIQINREKSEDYLKDRDIFESSIEFVLSISKAKKRR